MKDLPESPGRLKYIEQLSEAASNYLVHLIECRSDDRKIEIAFMHEAMRSEKLRRAAKHRLDEYRQGLLMFYDALGSSNADADAQITLSLLQHLEHEALVIDSVINYQFIEKILQRHITNTLMAISPS